MLLRDRWSGLPISQAVEPRRYGDQRIAKPLVANVLRNLKTVGRRNAQLIGSFTGRAQGESTSPPP